MPISNPESSTAENVPSLPLSGTIQGRTKPVLEFSTHRVIPPWIHIGPAAKRWADRHGLVLNDVLNSQKRRNNIE
ncbi:MAG: hypothetical protein AAGC93_26950 [Cyanobacteria bacterium P01_F01_bin.53]